MHGIGGSGSGGTSARTAGPRARWIITGLALALTMAGAEGAVAQDAPRGLRVYLDCQTRGCDFDHFRREITFATWVRDRQDAQVHVLVTGRGTGGGGREFTLTFFGRERFALRHDTLTTVTSQTATDAEARDELTRVMALGLVPFAVRNGAPRQLRVFATGPAAGERPVSADLGGGWDFWVFRVRGGGFLRGESLQNSLSGDGGVSASRTTEALKIRFGVNGRYQRDQFRPDSAALAAGDTTVVYSSHNWRTYGLAGLSIGEHWAAGARIEVGGGTFFNQDLFLEGGPTVEYNVFPYSESTRRVLAATLTVGAIARNYAEPTIFGRTRETHPVHSLELQFSQQQPWGEVHSNVEWLQYWHDPNVHLIEMFTGMEVRIVKGLSFDLSGSFARVKDQLYLSAAGLSEEDILRERKARGTSYRFRLSFGLSYTFGATDNSIVNPRLDL